MANIKFSAFTAEAEINNFEGVVGYNTTGNLNLRIAPLEMPARYDLDIFNVALGDSTTLRGTSIASGGERNIGIGLSALQNVTTAVDNIALGYQTLNSLTAFGAAGSGENIAIGTDAQFSNGLSVSGAGDENVGIGHRALYSNTGFDGAVNEGAFNVAVGGRSLEDVDTGDRNTAIGHNSGNTITIGYSNCLMGFEVGAGAITGNSMLDQNFAIGIGQWAVPQGNGSIVIGYQAEATNSLVSPLDTIVIGRESTCDMRDNIVIGSNSTYTGATASDTGKSILIGNATTVVDDPIYTSFNGKNTIVGSVCDITGNYHTHVGYYAIITGEDNASVGYYNEIYGTNNVGLGDNSYIGTGASDSNNCVALGGDITIGGGINGSMCIGAGTTSSGSGILEVGFGGSASVAAINDIKLVGANGGGVGASQINVVDGLSIETGPGTLQVGEFECEGNSQFTAPVNINNKLFLNVQGTTATTPVSPDFTEGNIITWDIVGDVDIDNPTIPILAGGTTAGTYIIIMKNPGAHTISLLGASWKWQGGAVAFPGVTGTAILTWVGDGTNFYGTIAQNFS